LTSVVIIFYQHQWYSANIN